MEMNWVTKLTGMYSFVKRKRYRKLDAFSNPNDSMMPLLPRVSEKQRNMIMRVTLDINICWKM